MTFPVVQDVKRGKNNNVVSARNVQLPATINAGDILLALFSSDSDSAVSWDNATAGAWTQLHSTVQADGEMRFSAFWKIADGSEDGLTLSVSTASATRTAWHIYRISGGQSVAAATPATAAGRTFNPDPPSVTPSWGSADTLWIVGLGIDGQAGGVAAPSPYDATAIFDQNTTPSCTVASGYRTNAAASENPAAWTLDNEQECVRVTYAIEPVAVSLVAPLVTSAAQFFAPTVGRGDVTLSPPLVSSPAVFFSADLLVPSLVQAERAEFPAVFYAPALDAVAQPLDAPFFESRAEFFRPYVGGGSGREAPVFEGIAIGGGTQAGFDWDEVDERWEDIEDSWAIFTKGGIVSNPIDAVFGDLAVYNTELPSRAMETDYALRGPIGFNDFRTFIAGEYNFQNAVIWMKLLAPEPFSQTLSITHAKLNVDVPDVRIGGTTNIPPGGAWVDFGRTFYSPPNVVASCVRVTGVSVAPKAIVHDDPPVETTRFFVTVCTGDDISNSVAGRIAWAASGI